MDGWPSSWASFPGSHTSGFLPGFSQLESACLVRPESCPIVWMDPGVFVQHLRKVASVASEFWRLWAERLQTPWEVLCGRELSALLEKHQGARSPERVLRGCWICKHRLPNCLPRRLRPWRCLQPRVSAPAAPRPGRRWVSSAWGVRALLMGVRASHGRWRWRFPDDPGRGARAGCSSASACPLRVGPVRVFGPFFNGGVCVSVAVC